MSLDASIVNLLSPEYVWALKSVLERPPSVVAEVEEVIKLEF